jgi:hypothetical protein
VNRTMKLLTTRHVSFSYPISLMRGACGALVPSAESVALWLRAWPGLLGWRPSINWLWPRVVDWRRRTRSRLWGIDSIGSLVIVEIRIDRGKAWDPFENFVRYFEPAGNPPPVLVIVVATTRSDFGLSPKASRSLALLQKHVGSKAVLLRSITAKLVPQGLHIKCRTLGSNDRGKSVTTPIY